MGALGNAAHEGTDKGGRPYRGATGIDSAGAVHHVKVNTSGEQITEDKTYDSVSGTSKVKTAPMFGEPIPKSGGSGAAIWEQNPAYTQKGTGWQAKLTGGAQSGDDWGSIFFPSNEMLVTDFDDANWTWYQQASAAYGVNIVIWVHNPNNYDERAEITQSGSATSLDKATGWNSHEFPSTAAEYFWYGEEGSSSPGITEGALATWAAFQADAVFSTWRIYRATLDFGWYSTGTFTSVWVTEFAVNGEQIPIRPGVTESLWGNKLKRVRTTVDIDTDWTGAIAAGDILSNDDCCTTIATYWTFSDVGFTNGGYVEIVYAKIITEVENVTPQYTLHLYNVAPTTGSFLSGAVNTHPRKEDYLNYLGRITFPQCEAEGANVASSSEVGPSTVGRIPKGIKCAAGNTDLYGVLEAAQVGYTHTDNDDITIDLYVFPA